MRRPSLTAIALVTALAASSILVMVYAIANYTPPPPEREPQTQVLKVESRWVSEAYCGDGNVMPGRLTSRLMASAGKVFFGGEPRSIYALDASNGELAWRYKVKERADALIEAGGNIIYKEQYQGEIIAVDAASGERRWNYLTPPVEYAAPLLVASEDTVFVQGAQTVTALDPSDGKVQWQKAYGVPMHNPVYTSGLLFATCFLTEHSHGVTTYSDFHIKAIDKATGNEVWRTHLPGTPSMAPTAPVAAGENIVAVLRQPAGSLIIAIRRGDGSIAWQRDIGGEVDSLLGTGATLLALTDSGLLALNAGNGRNQWQLRKDPEADWGDPVETSGLVILPQRGRMLMLDPQTGKAAGSFQTSYSSLTAATVLDDGIFYSTPSDNCIVISATTVRWEDG